jgi:hypothetical protein
MSARAALAYICVAFLGAVSVAFPLLFAHLLALVPPRTRTPPPPSTARHSWPWILCVSAALLSIVALPLTVHSHRALFIAALALVHGVLALPYLGAALGAALTARAADGAADGAAALVSTSRALSPTALRVLACVTAALHAWAAAGAVAELRAGSPHELGASPAALAELARALVAAAARNVCQASIAIDAVLSTTAGLAFMAASAERDESAHVLACCALSPLAGPAASLALFCARRAERDRDAPAAVQSETPDVTVPADPLLVEPSQPEAAKQPSRRRSASPARPVRRTKRDK